MTASDPSVPTGLAQLVSEARVLAAIGEVKDLPAAAPVVLRALSYLEDPDYTVNDLKRVLMSDQAVAARILRLANSAYFGFRSEVQTVSQAVVLLGQNRIRTLLHRILVDRLLSELGHGQAAEIRRLSLATATTSCMLSQLLAHEDAEEMLLAGLLHNIGELFCFARFPSHYAALQRGQGFSSAFGISWARAGRLLLEAWSFPLLYPMVAEFCTDPLSASCPPEYRSPVWLVHAGRKLAEAHLAGGGPSDVLDQMVPQIREAVHLDPNLVAEIFATLPQRMSLEQLQAARS